MTNTGGLTIPAKEFEGKLWILADAYQQAMQAAYMGGVLAEREACAKVCESLNEDFDSLGVEACIESIRARGKE